MLVVPDLVDLAGERLLGRLRGSIETIAKQVSDHANTIESMKKELVEGGKQEMETAIREIKKEKNEWLREQENFNKTVHYELDRLAKNHHDTEGKIDDSLSTVQRLRDEPSQLMKWQGECREVSRHSKHLLSAADSVFSAHQQFLDSQQFISEHLEGIRKELQYVNNR